MSSGSYRTVSATLRHEGEKVKGSRFIATVAPLVSTDEITGIVERLRNDYPAANHHCWAYRRGTGRDDFRYSDDGEPSGSAGRPILQQIDGHGVTDTLVVVTRIFGGTKLGVGGLVRAYGAAAGEVLDRVEIREVIPVRRIRLRFAYEQTGAVSGLLVAAGLEPSGSDYGESVTLELEVPEEQVEGFLADLGERTAGRVTVEKIGPERGALDGPGGGA